MNLSSWRSFSTIRGSKSIVSFIAFLLVGDQLHFSVASFALVAISAVLGCRGPGFAGSAKTQALVTPSISPEDSQQDSVVLTASEEVTVEKPEAEALAEVLDELTASGVLDADEKQSLMADLREAKRENWPLIVRQFQSALAYREQLAAREQRAAEKTTEPLVAKRTTRPKVLPVSFEIQNTLPAENRSPAVVIDVPEPPQVLPKPPLQVVRQASFDDAAADTRAAATPNDWQGHLQHSIDDLKTLVQPAPGSTDEVNQHMRLRLLQLLAGKEETALGPIPGATASQQDYWNQQLFAVSTFLDSKQQPDDRHRATSSLMQLDQARAKLAEMATMQVRNLAFVDSVEGYGAYELHEKTKFRPGDQVTLYAEIENFGSESTKEGYRTRLGTSYEVVDKNGKRVDSAEFPEVEDLCRNPRRDFHMQYTVTLPTRIYADEYEIRLIVTDQQSHKIGQASVSFEIIE